MGQAYAASDNINVPTELSEIGSGHTRLAIDVNFNQARAGLWPERTWFLKIVSVQTSVCVCVCLCVCPEAINN